MHPSPDKSLTVYGLGPGERGPRGIRQTPILGQWATLGGNRGEPAPAGGRGPGLRGSKGQHSPVNGVAPAAQLLHRQRPAARHQLQPVEDHVHREHEGQRERVSRSVVAQLQPHQRASAAAGARERTGPVGARRRREAARGERAVARRQGVQHHHFAPVPGLHSNHQVSERVEPKRAAHGYPEPGVGKEDAGAVGAAAAEGAPGGQVGRPRGLSLRRGCLSL